MDRSQWIHRKFRFDAPEGWMQNVLERLRGTEPRLRQMCRGISGDLAARGQNGAWSIKEHIGHLADLEELHTGRVDDFEAGLDVLRAADMSNAKTRAASHNTRSMDELIDDFARKRENLIERLSTLDDATQMRSVMHPRLQVPMRPIDMAIFTAEHDDHHLASMRQIMTRGSTIPKS